MLGWELLGASTVAGTWTAFGKWLDKESRDMSEERIHQEAGSRGFHIRGKSCAWDIHGGNIGLERCKTVLWPGEWIEGLDR